MNTPINKYINTSIGAEPAVTTAPEVSGPLSEADVLTCVRVLRAIETDRSHLAALTQEQRRELVLLAGRVAKPDRHSIVQMAKAFRKADRQALKQRDRAVLEQAALRVQRKSEVYQPLWLKRPPADALQDQPTLNQERVCYVCKQPYTKLHRYYDSMCEECGEFNYAKREQTADLSGQYALVTGARVKIGYQASLKLLRAGAHVIVVTRFPVDAADRYSQEADYAEFCERLEIHGLDLRHTPSVEVFARLLNERLPRLDYIVNNACQTVRRPAGFFQHLLARESVLFNTLAKSLQAPLLAREQLRTMMSDSSVSAISAIQDAKHPLAAHDRSPADRNSAEGLIDSAALSQRRYLDEDFHAGDALYPSNRYDEDRQQVDLRAINSWRLRLHEVETPELLEVHLVNALAPYILNARLKPLMMRTPGRHKHVVNVSAMEGQFYRAFKTEKHPHTNMAKAALNMMTRTSAPDFVKDGIHMNSIDTGWVTDEDPIAHAARKAEEGFSPPLDIIDGAARILDTIFVGQLTGTHVWGQFLKDYKSAPW